MCNPMLIWLLVCRDKVCTKAKLEACIRYKSMVVDRHYNTLWEGEGDRKGSCMVLNWWQGSKDVVRTDCSSSVAFTHVWIISVHDTYMINRECDSRRETFRHPFDPLSVVLIEAMSNEEAHSSLATINGIFWGDDLWSRILHVLEMSYGVFSEVLFSVARIGSLLFYSTHSLTNARKKAKQRKQEKAMSEYERTRHRCR
jgi:hypothetical protein